MDLILETGPGWMRRELLHAGRGCDKFIKYQLFGRRYHWMYNATAYNHAYGDTGLFCIHAASPPQRIGDTVDVLLRELVAMAGDCGSTELRVRSTAYVTLK